jgi:hypothetical protein
LEVRQETTKARNAEGKMKADQSQPQGLFQEALSRALEHHSWALAEYQDQMQIGGDPEDLERFKISVAEPALVWSKKSFAG